MCGRFTSTTSADDLAEAFDVDEVRTEPLPARYNVAPTQPVYVVAASGGRRLLGSMRWGLVPSWAPDASVGTRMINARAETVSAKAAFKDAMARRRCIIPADSFFEWPRRGRRAGRLAHVFRPVDGRPMAFAGLWETWRDPRQPHAGPLRTCSIITTVANDVVAPVHDRMPVVLPAAGWAAWLDPGSPADVVEALLVPAPAARFEAHAVSSLVNNVNNEGPQLVEPFRPLAEQASMIGPCAQ